MLDSWARLVGEIEYQWVPLRKALMFISMFFKDGLEKFEVNRNVQISSMKSGLRIDAETTANRLLEGTPPTFLRLELIVIFCLVIARQTPMLEELSGPSRSLLASSGSPMF